MYDITKLHSVINHLQSISSYYKDQGNELIMFCSYCDDATRPKANHGHLYISKSSPVYYCFRCSSSGNLIRLLIDTGFEDQDILKYLGQFIKYKSVKDYYKTQKTTTKLKQIQEDIIKRNIDFEINYKDKFEMYNAYLHNRFGNIDFSQFLISPTFFYGKLSCMFTNTIGEDVALRLIEPYKDYRYHLNPDTSTKYYFQKRDFENISNVVMGEGPFDIINLFLYSLEFRNSYYVALNGKKYSSMIETLILEEFLIGDIQFDLIFDSDVSNYRTYIYRARMLAKQYNQNVNIRGWRPLIGKDSGDYPALVEVQ